MTLSKLFTFLMFLNASSAFTISADHSRSQTSIRRTYLLMAAVTTPPPPSAIEQVKISSTNAASPPMTSTSNLPSQKQLSDMIQSSNSAPSKIPPKSTNVASGNGIMITDIHYDGDVPKTESDEYVVISNLSNSPMDISGYYIYVATTGTQGPTFTFPRGTVIKPGSSFRVYTNEIHRETGGFSFGSGKAIWSNNGGLAVIKDNNGKKLGEYKYKP
jgi:Intermediate filament tail domain.